MRRTGRYLFTSESVTEGHPDKIADQVSDAVLDAILEQDPMGRVACETLLTTGLIVLAGEITTTCTADFRDVARSAVREVGYTRAKYGFDADTCAVLSALQGQSPDIAMGVDSGGAGDQGLMFGYACSETEELMPLPDHDVPSSRAGAVRRAAQRPDQLSAPRRKISGYRGVRRGISRNVSTRWLCRPSTATRCRPARFATTSASKLFARLFRVICSTTRQKSSLIQQADSLPVAPRGIPALQGARSLLTPTEVWRHTAAARSPARTQRKLTAPPRTWPATSPRTVSLPA